MAVNVIDTIKPKNNGTFPVVEAADVKVDETHRLDTALNAKANQSELEILSTAVAGKADSDALAETNAAVALKANSADVQTALSQKADISDLDSKADNTTVTNITSRVVSVEEDQSALSARMDTFASLAEGSTTGDAELTDIRVGANGTTYTDAGTAVRSQVGAINTDIHAVSDNLGYPVDSTLATAIIGNGGGGTNNRLIYYPGGYRLPLDGNSFISISSIANIEISVEYIPDASTTAIVTEWKKTPCIVNLPDKCLCTIYFKHSDGTAFSNVNELDGIVHVCENSNIKELTLDLMSYDFLDTTVQIPKGADVGAQLGAGGTITPNNRLMFYPSGKPLRISSNDKLCITAFNERRKANIIFTTKGGVTTETGWQIPPIVYTPPENGGSIKLTFANARDDIAFESISDVDGHVIVFDTDTRLEKIENSVSDYPKGKDVGAVLAAGGTITPNNRLKFYTASNPLKISSKETLKITKFDDNKRVAIIYTDKNGTSTDTGWMNPPVVYSPPEDGGNIQLSFANSADNIAFSSISDADGHVIVMNPISRFVKIEDDILYKEELKNVSNARYVMNSSTPPLTLLHFSDIHEDKAALSRINKFIEYFGDNIDDAICTGDMVGDVSGEIADWWNEKILTCIGNHDTATKSGGVYDWTALGMSDRYAYYIAPFKSNWDIEIVAGKSYYYKDYSDNKVRLIVMDNMVYKNNDTSNIVAQEEWLTNLLDDAISNAYHVVIALHGPHGGSAPTDTSFSRLDETTLPTYPESNTPDSVINIVASKITSGLNFIGYICGHTHQDNIWDATGDGTQYMYTITCANSAVFSAWRYSDQHRSSAEDAFNLFTIDTSRRIVKIIRCGGANIDMYMRDRKYICINYKTGEIIKK